MMELKRGEVIKSSLLQSIEESLSAIVVLSKNYATSTWCLRELLMIVRCQKELGLHVFPIFYEIDPSDVRHQIGSFGEAFNELEQNFAHDEICRWRDALKEVSHLSGFDSQHYRYESKLIEEVVETVESKLYGQPPFDLNDDGLVGIDKKIEELDELLANTSEEVKFIGIWGMGGSGKTTLATTFYQRRKENYDVDTILQNVREKSTPIDGLISLQEELLSYLKRRFRTKMDDGRIRMTVAEGKRLIQRRMCNKKVLLVLDDVSDINQLENLAGKEGWFGKGSIIIITTRDQSLLVGHSHSQYGMVLLSPDESLQLFIQRAFKGNQPNKEMLELSKLAIKSAKGLPLALKVFGSFLSGKNIPEWEDARKMIPSSNDIFNTLKVSFDGLGPNEKTIFLDIACFFNGMAKKNVMQILENIGLRPVIGIRVLLDKSMIIEDKGCLRVHDILQEMGKTIVIRGSPEDIGKRSRIWLLEDANQVLKSYKRGTEAIRGIVVRFDQTYNIRLHPKAFSNMSNLKLLIISSDSHFSHGQMNCKGLECLSNTLKVIEWEGYPFDFLPSQTDELDELVDLKMQHSKLQELWTGAHFLQSLKLIDLSHSTNLITTPNFDNTPNLQRLILGGCTKLVEVHCSLGQHKNLVVVDFGSCESIKILPTKFEMSCLEKFVLSGCAEVKKLPEFGECMERLSELDLEATTISKLSHSLVNLIGLTILNLMNCKNLVCLPHDFQKLRSIKKINIAGCSRFSRLPGNLNDNEALEKLDVRGTTIKEVPSSLNNLKRLHLSGCKSLFSSSTKFLWSSPSHLSSLIWLDISYCSIDDESRPSEIGNLSSLTTLYLGGNNFVEFPSSLISKLQRLEYINFQDCQKLKSFPQLPSNVSIIKANDCPLLEHYVREQQIWEFIVQFESQTRCQTTEILDDGSKLHRLCNYSSIIKTWDAQIPDFFMQPTRLLTITGAELPSWFHNQEYFCAEDFHHEDTPTNVSFRVNLPDSYWSSELWGIAVCLVLEQDSLPKNILDFVRLCWTYRLSSGEYSSSHSAYWIFLQHSCCHQRSIIYIRFSSFVVKKLQMVFFIMDHDLEEENSYIKIEKCGWRVLCKEDVERWQKSSEEGCSSRNDDKLIVEEGPLLKMIRPSTNVLPNP